MIDWPSMIFFIYYNECVSVYLSIYGTAGKKRFRGLNTHIVTRIAVQTIHRRTNFYNRKALKQYLFRHINDVALPKTRLHIERSRTIVLRTMHHSCMNNMQLILAAIAVFCTAPTAAYSNGVVSPEQRLVTDLFTNYNPEGRPVAAADKRIKVWVTININVVSAVDTETESMTSTFYLHLSWYDELLTWNASDYGGVGMYWFNLIQYQACIL